MKLGAEDKKKVGLLAGLALVGGYLFYSNVLSDPNRQAAPRPAQSSAASQPSLLAPSGAGKSQPQTSSIRRATPGRTNKGDEFHPTLRSKRPEDQIDPATIDPTLRLDLLAKVQAVNGDGGARNIFQFGQAPPATPTADPKKLGPEPKIKVARIYGPLPPPPKTPETKPVKPPPPPINLKYYGYSTGKDDGRKTAFFLDGEDILVAPEGTTVKKRYKVVRVGVNSVMMEDVESNSQQSLPLAAEAGA